MILEISICSPPRFQPLSSSSSYSQAILGLQRPFNFRPVQASKKSIVCSISQIHNYGTVDYERRPILKWSSLYRRISMMKDPSLGSASVLNQWEMEERKLTKWDLCRVVKELRKYHRYKMALEVYEWMHAQGKRFRLSSSDAAIQLDLISKVHDIPATETYFSKLPESFKEKRTYGALLNAYVQAKMKEKAEKILQDMKTRGFTDQPLSFNVMMTLYLNLGEYEKVFPMIMEMRKSNVSLDICSYNIWITACGATGDLERMEKLVEKMTSEDGINPIWTTYSTMATMYINRGVYSKAENCLKNVELRLTGRDRIPYHFLLSLYARIGKMEEVYRIWDIYKSILPNIPNLGYRLMISTLVRLDNIAGAERIYEEWLSNRSVYDPRVSNVLMACYVRNGYLKKAIDFLNRMYEVGGPPNPNTWEILAEGYIANKQLFEALNCMKEAEVLKRDPIWRPKPDNAASMLALCEEQGDHVSKEAFLEILRNLGCLDNEAYVFSNETTHKDIDEVDGNDGVGYIGNHQDHDCL